MHLHALACGCDCLEIHLLAAIVDFGSWLWLCFGHLSPSNNFLCLGWEFAYGCDCLRSTCWLPLLTSVLSFGCALDICLLHMASFVLAGSLLFLVAAVADSPSTACSLLWWSPVCWSFTPVLSGSWPGLHWAEVCCLFLLFLVWSLYGYQDAPSSCFLLCVRLGTF
jgi:hypothetical protein